jgi:hypothetical protein
MYIFKHYLFAVSAGSSIDLGTVRGLLSAGKNVAAAATTTAEIYVTMELEAMEK